MPITIALAGNPNSGKTTLFNALTGSNQFVGNWPGVTVEKKEGKLKKNRDVLIMDLPGIYSLSPYTLEEVVARDYLINTRPDAILNIVDGTNLERNLYLSTQLAELGIPLVVAVNMIDVVKKRGDVINLQELSRKLGCRVVEISALKGTGITEAAEAALKAAAEGNANPISTFSGSVEHALAHIEEAAVHSFPQEQHRWYAIKIFERDERVLEHLELSADVTEHIESDISAVEQEFDDDAESIITNERYLYISSILKSSYRKKNSGKLSTSDKIDKIVTNRFLGLPIFALVMFLVYYIAVTTVGSWATDWTNENLFGDGWHLFGIGATEFEEMQEARIKPAATVEFFEKAAEEAGTEPKAAKDLVTTAYIYDDKGNIEEEFPVTYADYLKALESQEPDPKDYGIWVRGIPVLATAGLESIGTAEWLKGLVVDGIIAGVGAVLGFVPQMLVLFLLLAFLEACGYMARIAFVLDRVFRKFGLSGKSFIPILIGTGCGIPGVMASRTIENDRDRKMTIMTTTFIPCSAKLPIIALIAGALFADAWWVAPSAYFIGIAAIITSGIILKKTKMFAGDVAPFVMELPAYHWPTVGNVLRSTWERGWSFIKKAGTIILLATIFVWFTSHFGWEDGKFGMVEMNSSILAKIGGAVAFIFAPLGWGHWQGAVATVTGLIAKENVVGTFGVLFGGFEEVAENGWQVWANMRQAFTPIAAYSFLVFNLLCAPCFAAIGAIRREMNNAKWTWFAILYQTVFAYVISLIVYQLGMLIITGTFGVGTAVALIFAAAFIYLLFRKQSAEKSTRSLSNEAVSA
ncbi:MAG: ferrous iron transporter B [Ruminococcaceae bacterium]|nr:ferrous iron transporter B [Oscillospiraceae bacterium]